MLSHFKEAQVHILRLYTPYLEDWELEVYGRSTCDDLQDLKDLDGELHYLDHGERGHLCKCGYS